MKKLILPIMALALLWAVPCRADDICTHAMLTAKINISSATTTQVAAIGTLTNYRVILCGYDFTVSGTSPTYEFYQGTGTNCGTGGAAISGAYAPTSGNLVHFGGAGATINTTASGDNLCIVSGGTSPSIQGIIDYVIAP